MPENLWEKFADPEYLQVYNESLIDTTVSTQILTLREAREWTQTELARKAGMRQSRISELEDADYSSWTVTTLRRLAAAFGCGLVVRFAPPSEIVDWANSTSAAKMRPLSYADEVEARKVTAQVRSKLNKLSETQAGNQHRLVVNNPVGQIDFGLRADLRLVPKQQSKMQLPSEADKSGSEITSIPHDPTSEQFLEMRA